MSQTPFIFLLLFVPAFVRLFDSNLLPSLLFTLSFSFFAYSLLLFVWLVFKRALLLCWWYCCCCCCCSCRENYVFVVVGVSVFCVFFPLPNFSFFRLLLPGPIFSLSLSSSSLSSLLLSIYLLSPFPFLPPFLLLIQSLTTQRFTHTSILFWALCLSKILLWINKTWLNHPFPLPSSNFLKMS